MSPVICSQCGNPIDDEDALLCHFCGGSLNRSSGGLLGGMRAMRFILIAIVFILAAVMLATMF